MPEDSDVNPFEEELRADSYTGNLETHEAQIDAEHWYHDPEEWWRDSSNYQRQAMLVGAGITDLNLASFEYYDLSEDIQRQLAEDSIMYSPESKANEDYPPALPEGKKYCPRCRGTGRTGDDGMYECERCNGDKWVASEAYGQGYGIGTPAGDIIWKHFNEVHSMDQDDVFCNHCGKMMTEPVRKAGIAGDGIGGLAQQQVYFDHLKQHGITESYAKEEGTSDGAKKGWLTRKRGGSSAEEPSNVDHDWAGSVGATKSEADQSMADNVMIKFNELEEQFGNDKDKIIDGLLEEFGTTTFSDDVHDIFEDENYHELNRLDGETSSDKNYYDGIAKNTMDILNQSKINGFPFFAYAGKPKSIYKDRKGGITLDGMKGNPNSIKKININYDEGRDTFSVSFHKKRDGEQVDDVYFDQLSGLIAKKMGIESKASEGFTVQVKDDNGSVSWQQRYDTKEEAEKVRRKHEKEHGYSVSIIDSDYEGESKANEKMWECGKCDGTGKDEFGYCYNCKGTGQLSEEEMERKYQSDQKWKNMASQNDDYIDGSDVPKDGFYESKATEGYGWNGKWNDLDPNMKYQVADAYLKETSGNFFDLSEEEKNEYAMGYVREYNADMEYANAEKGEYNFKPDGAFMMNQANEFTQSGGKWYGKWNDLDPDMKHQVAMHHRLGGGDSGVNFEDLSEEEKDEYAIGYVLQLKMGNAWGVESKASENFTFYEDASHGWLEVPKSLLKELGIVDQISSYSYQSGDMAYLEEDADLSLFISKYGNVNTNNPQDGKHIRNYGNYVGESVTWTNASFNRKLDALESLGITQGDAVRLASVAYEDLSEDLKKDLELPYTEEDAETEQEIFAQNEEKEEDVDYNNIGESRTARTKYECEHCNCGFKSNESLSTHYNQIHAVVRTPIEGYENWKDVADDLYEKEQSRRKKGGEALDIFGDEMPSELDIARRRMKAEKELQGKGTLNGLNLPNYDEYKNSLAGFDWQEGGEALDPMWFEKFAGRSGVKRIPVENFLGTIDMNPDEMSAWGNFERDASMYNWNSKTKKAISDGIVYYYNNAGESKANEIGIHGGDGASFYDGKTFTCEFCGKVGDDFSIMAQEICPSNNGNGHQVPIFGDQVKPKPIPTLSGESKANEENPNHAEDGKFASGSGNDKDYPKIEEHPYGEEELFLCGKCKGSGEINGKECPRCGGTGAGGAKESKANEDMESQQRGLSDSEEEELMEQTLEEWQTRYLPYESAGQDVSYNAFSSFAKSKNLTQSEIDYLWNEGGANPYSSESKANEDRVLNEDIPQNHCPNCGSYKTSYDTDEKMNVCDDCGNRFEYKSSESLQSTLNRGFDNMMVMDQSDMFRCKECSQMFDIWRIEHELHQDPEEVLNSHLQSHESKANEDYPPALPEGEKHCPRCGGSGEIDKDIYGQSIGGIYRCERCDGDGFIGANESKANEGLRDSCVNCKEGDHEYCLFDPEGSGNMCGCSVCDNTYEPNEYQMMQQQFGSDGGSEISDFQYAKEDFVHQAGYPPESASDKPYDWWEGQGEFMIDTTKDDLHQEIKMAGDRGVYDVSINNGLVGVDANAWELVKAKEELEREGKIKRGSRYDKMFEGGEWEPYGHKEPSEYWFDSSVNFGSESYAKEDSLVKIEDDNDDDTQVTVLDEWENETDPDVGGKTEDINATEGRPLDDWLASSDNYDGITLEDVSQEWWDNNANPHEKARILNKTGSPVENTFDLPSYDSLSEQTKTYLSTRNDFSFESKASEGEWENELAMDWWKSLSQSEQDEIRKEEPFILSDNDLIVEQYMKRVGESKATEFDYNKWENAEDGNVLVPDEDLKEIKDLEKQLDGENVCPECGDKTDDDKEFEDHLNAHRFEEEV